jgi:hypothetical protein
MPTLHDTVAPVPGDPAFEFLTLHGVTKITAWLREWLRQPDLTERQVYHKLQNGLLPGTHDGAHWTLRPARLLQEQRMREDEALAEAAQRRARLAAAKAGDAGDAAKEGNGEQHESEPPRPKRRGRRAAKVEKGHD